MRAESFRSVRFDSWCVQFSLSFRESFCLTSVSFLSLIYRPLPLPLPLPTPLPLPRPRPRPAPLSRENKNKNKNKNEKRKTKNQQSQTSRCQAFVMLPLSPEQTIRRLIRKRVRKNDWTNALNEYSFMYMCGSCICLPGRPESLGCFCFGSSKSTRSVSKLRLSGSKKYLMFDPLTLSWSKLRVLLPFGVTFTFLRWVFMAMSTPVIVPATTVPFLSSMVTVSLLSFIKNRTSLTMLANYGHALSFKRGLTNEELRKRRTEQKIKTNKECAATMQTRTQLIFTAVYGKSLSEYERRKASLLLSLSLLSPLSFLCRLFSSCKICSANRPKNDLFSRQIISMFLDKVWQKYLGLLISSSKKIDKRDSLGERRERRDKTV